MSFSLQSYRESRVINEPLQSRWYHKAFKWGGVAVSTVAAVACGALRFFVRQTPLTSTLTAVGFGASVRGTLEIALPEKGSRVIRYIEKRNTFALYFMLTQLYLNLPDDSTEKEIVFSIIAALGGSWIVLKVTSVAQRRLADTIEEEPLLEHRLQPLFLEPNSRAAFFTYQIGKSVLGGSMISAAHFVGDYHGTLYNSGMLLVGHTIGTTLETGLFQIKQSIKDKHEAEIIEDDIPLSLRSINVIERAIDTFGNHGWGVLFVVNRPVGYLAAGSLIGFTKMMAKRRFEVRTASLSKFYYTMHKMDRWLNALFGVGLAGWVTAVLIMDSSLIDRIAIASMGGSVAMGFALRVLLNQKKEESAAIINSLDFYMSEHPVIWVLPFSYIWEQMKIGDIALQGASTETIAIASTAWASLGVSLGIDRVVTPPNFSPIVDSLYGNFFAWAIKGKA